MTSHLLDECGESRQQLFKLRFGAQSMCLMFDSIFLNHQNLWFSWMGITFLIREDRTLIRSTKKNVFHWKKEFTIYIVFDLKYFFMIYWWVQWVLKVIWLLPKLISFPSICKIIRILRFIYFFESTTTHRSSSILIKITEFKWLRTISQLMPNVIHEIHWTNFKGQSAAL